MTKYIDVDALKEKMENCFCNFKCVLPDIKNVIDEMPTADVSPVQHGEWQSDVATDEPCIRCSVCREVYECELMLEEFAMFYHYCPNCGAKMDGGK